MNFLSRSGSAAEGLTAAGATQTVLTPGMQVGPYRIETRLGAGGMGEVFRAVDTRLGRAVAIKTSHTLYTQRFERESRAISSLNHPNICTLYDVGPNYLVMELCEGETLEARIRKRALPLDEAVTVGAQIAAGLAAAHAKGIIHRDLKPANVILTKAGAKVLDFGLAKSATDETLTGAYAVMGTPAYMAPEQREGRPCDARTDIYALGLTLCAMISGKPDPAGIAATDSVPAQVIAKCLERDPDDRWQSAADIATLLQWKPLASPAVSPPRRPAWIPALLAAALAAIATAALAWKLLSPTPGEPVRFTEAPDGQVDNGNTFQVSPDGHFLAASLQKSTGSRRIWIRPIAESQGHWLEATDGAEAVFWSADSRWIGFFAGGRIRRIQAAGGPVESVAEASGLYCAAWNAAGDIIYAPFNRSVLYRIRSAGGASEPLTKLDGARKENSHRWPHFLADGRHYLFTARSTEAKNNTVYLGSLDSGSPVPLTYVESQTLPVRDALLFVREQSLFRQPFNGERLTGPAVALRGGVAQNPISAVAGFAASADGSVLVIHPGASSGSQLSWFNRRGEPAGTLGTEGAYYALRISPDGTRAVVDRPDGDRGNRDLWTVDLHSGGMARLTTDPANDMMGLWLPGGREIVFSSDRAGGSAMEFFRRSVLIGAAEVKLQMNHPNGRFDMMDISPDGRWGALSGHASPDINILLARLDAASPAVPFSRTSGPDYYPRFSPAGNWLSFTSGVSGRGEVFAGRYNRDTGAPEGSAIQISAGGASYSAWSRDGSELFFLGSDMRIYSVAAKDLESGNPAPVPLFRICPGANPITGTYAGYPYEPAPDGRFLCTCTRSQNSIFEFTIGSH